MISENLKNRLQIRAEKSELDFNSLISLMESSEYEFIGGKVIGALGVATHKRAYFNLDRLLNFDDQYIFFTILHEYCHMLAIDRIGINGVIEQFKETDSKKFASHFITEEILADRFGRLWFYVMNKKVFPHYRTQQLEKEENQFEYQFGINQLMGKISDEKTYNDSLYRFVGDWKPIQEYKPTWYKDVELLTKDGKIKRNFHRLQGDNDVYYGTLDGNDIILEQDVSHWRILNDE